MGAVLLGVARCRWRAASRAGCHNLRARRRESGQWRRHTRRAVRGLAHRHCQRHSQRAAVCKNLNAQRNGRRSPWRHQHLALAYGRNTQPVAKDFKRVIQSEIQINTCRYECKCAAPSFAWQKSETLYKRFGNGNFGEQHENEAVYAAMARNSTRPAAVQSASAEAGEAEGAKLKRGSR